MPEDLRLKLRKLVVQSQHEIVSYDGLSEKLRMQLVRAWGEVWMEDQEHKLDVEWVFNKTKKRKKLLSELRSWVELNVWYSAKEDSFYIPSKLLHEKISQLIKELDNARG